MIRAVEHTPRPSLPTAAGVSPLNRQHASVSAAEGRRTAGEQRVLGGRRWQRNRRTRRRRPSQGARRRSRLLRDVSPSIVRPPLRFGAASQSLSLSRRRRPKPRKAEAGPRHEVGRGPLSSSVMSCGESRARIVNWSNSSTPVQNKSAYSSAEYYSEVLRLQKPALLCNTGD